MAGNSVPDLLMARQKGALHNETTTRLREMIVSGELAPGAKLPEATFCDLFNISRTPLREALRTLAAEGLVELLPNRSAVVSKLNVMDLQDLYRVVAALEALAGRLACELMTPDDVAEIAEIHSNMLQCYEKGERAAYLKYNHLVHRRIVELADNSILKAQWLTLIPNVERARALANLDQERWLAAVSEHSKMLSALAARRCDEVARLVEAHFMNGLDYSRRHANPIDGDTI